MLNGHIAYACYSHLNSYIIIGNLVTVGYSSGYLVIIGYFLLTIDNLYILVYLYIDMFYILWVYNPL